LRVQTRAASIKKSVQSVPSIREIRVNIASGSDMPGQAFGNDSVLHLLPTA